VSKFHAVPVDLDGLRFDSKAEAARYGELKLLEAAGVIAGLRVHPRYLLVEKARVNGENLRAVVYEADFEYTEAGVKVAEDVKGGKATQTAIFRLKAGLFKRAYPHIQFRIVER
jgi:hypothetical protein